MQSLLVTLLAWQGVQAGNATPKVEEPTIVQDSGDSTAAMISATPIRLPLGASDGPFHLHVSISDDATARVTGDKARLEVIPAVEVGAAEVVFDGASAYSARGPSGVDFIFRGTVTGLAPGTTEMRWAKLTAGTYEQFVEFTLTSAVADTQKWSIAPPAGHILMKRGDRIPLLLTTGTAPVRGLAVAWSSLTEESTKARLEASDLRLCDADSAECNPPGTLSSGQVHDLFLDLPGLDERGTFTGSVGLSATGFREPIFVPIHIDSTFEPPVVGFLVGALAILAGVALSWYGSAVLRHRTRRTRMLIPVARLRDAFTKTKRDAHDAAEAARIILPGFSHQVAVLLQGLSEQELTSRGFLPSVWPPAFEPESGGDGLQDYVTEASAFLARLVIIKDGIVEAIKLLDGANLSEVRSAIQKLDDAARNVDPSEELAQLQARVDAIVDALRPLSAQGVSAARAKRSEIERIHTSLGALNMQAWFLWMAVTVVTGVLTLVMSDPGFGIARDFFVCFAWGLGVQTTGLLLPQLSRDEIGQTIGVTIPKSD